MKQSVAATCLSLPLALGAWTLTAAPALAEGVVHLFHRSAAEPMRVPRMAMWNACAERLDIEIIENFSPPKQYEVQLPVQLALIPEQRAPGTKAGRACLDRESRGRCSGTAHSLHRWRHLRQN